LEHKHETAAHAHGLADERAAQTIARVDPKT
jgi:hypothetical protein